MDLGCQLGYGAGGWYDLYKLLSLPPHVADALAMRSDWQMVGSDLRSAMAEMDQILAEHEDARQRVEEILAESSKKRAGQQASADEQMELFDRQELRSDRRSE